jgi:curved DNA-binding protein CbpA
MDNYFDILGIPYTANDLEINKAYKQMAHKYHPDKEGGSNDKFIEINKAKNILLDPNKKKEYIKYLLSALLTPNYIINKKPYIINKPEITGDGSAGNPFIEGKFIKRYFRGITIITPK